MLCYYGNCSETQCLWTAIGSFYVEEAFRGIGVVPMTFIRGPYIQTIGDGVEILATVDRKYCGSKTGASACYGFPSGTEYRFVHTSVFLADDGERMI